MEKLIELFEKCFNDARETRPGYRGNVYESFRDWIDDYTEDVSEACALANAGTSEKDLRVCEVNGSYLDGLSSGITACNAEFRVIMQNIYSELNNLPRINKSDMKRALYNHSSCELGEAFNPNMHEDSGE